MKPHLIPPGELPAPHTRGQVISWPRIYGAVLWLATRGREPAFRQKLADLALFRMGETVLDIGCGTGAQTLIAKERVGALGRVAGIEPSPPMIAYARRKAARRGLAIDFQLGVIEQLKSPDQSVDVALCIIVLHHMPDDAKRQGLGEVARVLKPTGRLLVVDSDLDLLPPLEKPGFAIAETGPLPILPRYHYALWKNDGPAGPGQP